MFANVVHKSMQFKLTFTSNNRTGKLYFKNFDSGIIVGDRRKVGVSQKLLISCDFHTQLSSGLV